MGLAMREFIHLIEYMRVDSDNFIFEIFVFRDIRSSI